MKLSLFIMLFLLSGCCHLCEPKIIYVAAECPKPAQVPSQPIYTLNDLASDASAKSIIEAYVLDLELCQTHAEKLENLLNAYGAEYKQYKIRYPDPPKK